MKIIITVPHIRKTASFYVTLEVELVFFLLMALICGRNSQGIHSFIWELSPSA